MSSRRASRLVRSVASCRPSRRSSARLGLPVRSVGSSRLSSRMGAVLFCYSLVLISFVVAVLPLRSRGVSFSPWHHVSSLRFAHRLVGSSRPHPVISSSARPWVSRIRSRALFPCSRRSVLLVAHSCSPIRSRFMSSVVGRGRVVMAMGRQGVCSSHLIRPLIVPCSLLTRCGMVAEGCGIWGAVPCCSPLVPLPAHAPSFLFIMSDPPRPHCVLIPIIHEARKPGAETEAKSDEDKTGTRKQRDG